MARSNVDAVALWVEGSCGTWITSAGDTPRAHGAHRAVLLARKAASVTPRAISTWGSSCGGFFTKEVLRAIAVAVSSGQASSVPKLARGAGMRLVPLAPVAQGTCKRHLLVEGD